MDGSLIYRKTRRGAAELTATHGGHVAMAARRVLIMLDGRRTLDELAGLFGPETVEHAIAELETQGLARLVDPEAGSQTTQQVLISGGEPELHPLEPELAPLEPKARRRGLAWIALALPALAIGGGYYIVSGADRAADAPRDTAVAVARSADPVRAAPLPGPDEQSDGANPNSASSEGPKELPLAGLPPVIVKAAATVTAPARRAVDTQADGATEVVPTAAPEPAPKVVAAANPPAPEAAPSKPREAAVATKAREVAAPPPVAPVVAETAPAEAPRPESSAPPLQVAAVAPVPLPAQRTVTLHPRKQDPPNFPGRALRARVSEGHVLARIWVGPDGKVDQVDIVSATPPRVFDDEVRRALTAWTFDPPGQPVSKTVELQFKP
jgi:protein TonB